MNKNSGLKKQIIKRLRTLKDCNHTIDLDSAIEIRAAFQSDDFNRLRLASNYLFKQIQSL